MWFISLLNISASNKMRNVYDGKTKTKQGHAKLNEKCSDSNIYCNLKHTDQVTVFLK